MARKERISKGRTMMPNYFVFCEGDTEVAYIEMLRSFYRLPIHIIAKKTLLNITPSLVERCKSAYVQTKNDRTYLMYDLDVPSMLERLLKVEGLLSSVPILVLSFGCSCIMQTRGLNCPAMSVSRGLRPASGNIRRENYELVTGYTCCLHKRMRQTGQRSSRNTITLHQRSID